MFENDSNIITLKIKYSTNENSKTRILEYIKNYNNVLRFTYISFPKTCVSIVVGQSNKNEISRVTALSASKYTLDCSVGSPDTVYVMAIGY